MFFQVVFVRRPRKCSNVILSIGKRDADTHMNINIPPTCFCNYYFVCGRLVYIGLYISSRKLGLMLLFLPRFHGEKGENDMGATWKVQLTSHRLLLLFREPLSMNFPSRMTAALICRTFWRSSKTGVAAAAADETLLAFSAVAHLHLLKKNI